MQTPLNVLICIAFLERVYSITVSLIKAVLYKFSE